MTPTHPGSEGPTKTPTGCYAQYFPEGTDLGKLTALELDQVADELDRPRNASASANPPNALLSYCCADRKDPPCLSKQRGDWPGRIVSQTTVDGFAMASRFEQDEVIGSVRGECS